MKRNVKKRKSGSVFILALIFTFVVGVYLSSILTFQKSFHSHVSKSMNNTKALYKAESAEQLALYQINHIGPPGYTTTAGWFAPANGWSFSTTKNGTYSTNAIDTDIERTPDEISVTPPEGYYKYNNGTNEYICKINNLHNATYWN